MDYRSRRLRTGLLLGTAFLGGVAIGPASGLIGRHLGYRSRPVGVRGAGQQPHRHLSAADPVRRRVRARPRRIRRSGDRQGPDREFDQRHADRPGPPSSYMNAKAFRDMQVQTKGEFGGLGIEVTQDNGFIKVISPIDDTPAFKAGVKAGDIITALDGKTVQGLSLQDAVDMMRGAPNSKITLTIKREGTDQPIEVSMLREIIHIQVVKGRLEPDNIGYVRLTQFTEQADPALKQAVKTLKQQAGGKLRRSFWTCATIPAGCSTRRWRCPATS